MPLIIVDLRPKADAVDHVLEGKSLQPELQGEGKGHDFIISELDYSMKLAARALDVDPQTARAYMVLTKQWKYIYFEGYPEQLLERTADPDELNDLGQDDDHKDIRMMMKLFEWSRNRRMRITLSEGMIKARHKMGFKHLGVHIGEW